MTDPTPPTPPSIETGLADVKLSSAPPSPANHPPSPPPDSDAADGINDDAAATNDDAPAAPTATAAFVEKLKSDYLNPTAEQLTALRENPYEYYKQTKTQLYDTSVEVSAATFTHLNTKAAEINTNTIQPLKDNIANKATEIQRDATEGFSKIKANTVNYIGERTESIQKRGGEVVTNINDKYGDIREKTVTQAKEITQKGGEIIVTKATEIKDYVDDNVIIPLSSSIGTILSRFKIAPFVLLADREAYTEFMHRENVAEIVIPARTEHTQVVVVPAGKKIDYKFVSAVREQSEGRAAKRSEASKQT